MNYALQIVCKIFHIQCSVYFLSNNGQLEFNAVKEFSDVVPSSCQRIDTGMCSVGISTLSKLWPLIYARESTFQKCKMI